MSVTMPSYCEEYPSAILELRSTRKRTLNPCQPELVSKKKFKEIFTSISDFFSSGGGGDKRELRPSLVYHKMSLNSIQIQK